jgi:DNA-binding LytR/AlgR family response regulator
MTLRRLEGLLLAAGDRHMRVHRSYVVNVGEVREVTPSGEGDLRLTLSDGTVAPGSRRYRERLLAAIGGRLDVR